MTTVDLLGKPLGPDPTRPGTDPQISIAIRMLSPGSVPPGLAIFLLGFLRCGSGRADSC